MKLSWSRYLLWLIPLLALGAIANSPRYYALNTVVSMGFPLVFVTWGVGDSEPVRQFALFVDIILWVLGITILPLLLARKKATDTEK